MAILKSEYLFLLSSLVLTGCYTDFHPDIETEPVLCINALVRTGEPIDVAVSRTWCYDDAAAGDDHSVSDASVTVYANGDICDAGYIPAEGDRIAITAESPVYGYAGAEVDVPRSVPMAAVRYSVNPTDLWALYEPEYGFNSLCLEFDVSIEIDIDDPAGIDNYYRYSYISFGNSDWNDYDQDDGDMSDSSRPEIMFYAGSFVYDSEPVFGEHIGVFESIMGGTSDGFTFFTDRQFSGGRYTLHLEYTGAALRMFSKPSCDDVPDCGLVITLSAVSPEYYNWASYVWQVNSGPLGELGDTGLGEPLWGYSNVSTGAGVVAAQTSVSYTVNLKNLMQDIISGGQMDE